MGFTPQESEVLDHFNWRRNAGTKYGAGAGLFLAYAWGHWYHLLKGHFPVLVKRPEYKLAMQAGLVLFSAWLGDYLATSRRYGANSSLVINFLNNRWYADQQDRIVKFTPLDRMFTDLEIQRFQEKMANPVPREWP
jgi:hypothetical protein